MCKNKPNWFHNNNSELRYDNKNKIFCVKSRCLCRAIALQFPQRVVPFFVFFFIVSKPELFYWKLCRLVSEETAYNKGNWKDSMLEILAVVTL